MPTDWGQTHAKLAQLISTMPAFDADTLSAEDHAWLGRAYVIVAELGVNNGYDAIAFTTAVDSFGNTLRKTHAETIKGCVFRALALAESKAPVAGTGGFIAIDSPFDALTRIASVLSRAKKDILILDAYLDTKFLTDFAASAPEGVSLRLLADPFYTKPALAPAVRAWQQQHGSKRPTEARQSTPRALHDRAIFVDGAEVWLLSQSFNALAARSPATVQQADPEITAQKLAYYQDVWSKATPL